MVANARDATVEVTGPRSLSSSPASQCANMKDIHKDEAIDKKEEKCLPQPRSSLAVAHFIFFILRLQLDTEAIRYTDIDDYTAKKTH